MNQHNNDFEWDAHRNEYGSCLYDLSHILEQHERESKARRFAWIAGVVVLALVLTILCYVYPEAR